MQWTATSKQKCHSSGGLIGRDHRNVDSAKQHGQNMDHDSVVSKQRLKGTWRSRKRVQDRRQQQRFEFAPVRSTTVPEHDRTLTYVEAFAGCGGLSLGLHQSGWEGLFAIEKDPM